jgi:hypothetical protein
MMRAKKKKGDETSRGYEERKCDSLALTTPCRSSEQIADSFTQQFPSRPGRRNQEVKEAAAIDLIPTNGSICCFPVPTTGISLSLSLSLPFSGVDIPFLGVMAPAFSRK